MEERAKAFAEFLSCTEGVSEMSDSRVTIQRFPDHISVTLEGGVGLGIYEPDDPEDPMFARYLTAGTEEINEPEWLARFLRTASEVIIEPDGDGLERLTLVFRDE